MLSRANIKLNLLTPQDVNVSGVGTTVVQGRTLIANEGEYLLTKRLGNTRHCNVYRAIKKDLAQTHKPIAVKLFKPKYYDENPQKVKQDCERSARYMEWLSQLNVEGIMAYYGHEAVSRYRTYIVMQEMECVNLHQHIEDEGPLSLDFVLCVVLQVAKILYNVHVAGVARGKLALHGDVKPGNIYLTPKNRVFVGDWDLASETFESGEHQGVFGTPLYMSPERWAGKTPYSPYDDIYALGHTMHYLLSGSHAYYEPYQSHIEICRKHLRYVVPSLPQYPLASELIKLMTARYASDRPYYDVIMRHILAIAKHHQIELS